MIIIKRPFIYLRDVYKWKHKKCSKNFVFLDPERFMLLEKRKQKDLVLKNSESNLTSKDAKYKIMNVNDFFKKVNYIKEDKIKKVEINKYGWNLEYVKLGLKIVRNAKIYLPMKIAFPLIIQNDEYNFYIAPMVDEK